VAGADQAAAEDQDDVEIDDAQRRAALHQAELIEDDRDDDRDEQLEESLDPQVDDPEPPGIDHREVAAAVEHQRRQGENRNRDRGDQEEDAQPAALGVAVAWGYVAPQQDEPEDQAEGQQDLPGAADFEKFPALVAEPEPGAAEPLQEACPLAEQA